MAPAHFPQLPQVEGLKFATASSGETYKGRKDVWLATFAPSTSVAGVFTTSKTASAPVEWCKKNLGVDENGEGVSDARARALIVNAGNANAFTGKVGERAMRDVVAVVAKTVGCPQKEVYVASTGVIGEPLRAEKVVKVLPKMVEKMKHGKWETAAKAISTTDTFPKGAGRTAEIDGVPVNIVGIAKGSGMIEPDLATMLSFIVTDAAIPTDVLQTLLIMGTRESFNAITVDSDTSTSDTVLLFATGAASGYEPIERAGDRRLKDFREKLNEVMIDLAHQIVKDGEGATKFISVSVSGAASTKAAKNIARAVANSPLVKTAIAGEDANWGRVVMAVGKAGEAADRDKISIRMCGLPVAKNGLRDRLYDEAALARRMKMDQISIEIDVGVGTGRSQIWTCDLTHGYISINADYRS